MAPAALARRGRSQGATTRASGRLPGGRGRSRAAARGGSTRRRSEPRGSRHAARPAAAACRKRHAIPRPVAAVSDRRAPWAVGAHAARPAAAACGPTGWLPAWRAGLHEPTEVGKAKRGTTPRLCVQQAGGVMNPERSPGRSAAETDATDERQDTHLLASMHVPNVGSARGRPCPGSRRSWPAQPRMGGAQTASSERRAGGPQRTSGDGAWATPSGGDQGSR